MDYKFNWKIYFCYIRMVELGSFLKYNYVEFKKEGIRFLYVNGCLFILEFMENFIILKKDESIIIKFKC